MTGPATLSPSIIQEEMVANSEREQLWQERVAQWQASGAIAARVCDRARLFGPSGPLLGAAADKCASVARVAAGAGRTSDCSGGRDQPAQRTRLDVDAAERCAAQLAGRTDACTVMQLSADAIWLATAAVDMRTGVDGLSLHVQQALGRAPCDSTVYVFANRRRTRLKLVCRDGTGVWMCLRCLHRGQFVWPQADEASWQMSAEQPRRRTCAGCGPGRQVRWGRL